MSAGALSAATTASASSLTPPPPPIAYSTPALTPPPQSTLLSFSSIGLGNAIAIALGFLVLLSTLLLAFYVCRRRHYRRNDVSSLLASAADAGGVVLPRIIFVAEGDDDDDGRGNRSPAPGLDEAAINSYPKFPFSRSKPCVGDPLCSICLCEYREGEMLRMLPDCLHRFHLTCVDAWLRLNASCPVCRTSPMPTPLSTPLSELVPLSLYSADRRRR